jgi:hypothetical protein
MWQNATNAQRAGGAFENEWAGNEAEPYKVVRRRAGDIQVRQHFHQDDDQADQCEFFDFFD